MKPLKILNLGVILIYILIIFGIIVTEVMYYRDHGVVLAIILRGIFMISIFLIAAGTLVAFRIPRISERFGSKQTRKIWALSIIVCLALFGLTFVFHR